MSIKDLYCVKKISKDFIKEWIMNTHYAKRRCSVSYGYGLIKNNKVMGICTFGSPASRPLCVGLCGKEYASNVLELNRLVKFDCLEKNVTSYFVSQCLNLLPRPKIVVSYADTSQNHNGYIYQACNFLYTGLSAKRTEWRMKNSNLHSKSICDRFTLEERKNNSNFYIAKRPQKHRYVIFIGNKTDKKKFKSLLKYKIQDYPKNDNKNYIINYYPNQQM